MKSRRFCRIKITVAIGGVVVGVSTAQHAAASAFALQEQSGSGLGNAFAGGAAAAEDVSTIFFNPAGMSRLTAPQVAAAVHVICPSSKFRDSASQPAAFQTLGGTGGDAGECTPVPNLYAALPINRQWAVGLGINVPFGLKTDYDADWIGRFQGVKSEVKTINVNPALSYKANNITVGIGANYQHIKAELTRRINYSAAVALGAQTAAAAGQIPATAVPPLIAASTGLQADARVDGDDNAWGWNIGALWEIDPQTRLGVAYRSTIKYTVSGNFSVANRPSVPTLPAALAPVGNAVFNGVNAAISEGAVKLSLEVPDTANVSLFRQLNPKWDVMGDIQWTGWSSVRELNIVRSTGQSLDVTPENFRDSWRFAVGANYHHTDQLMFRAGVAYDQTPVRDSDRTPRLPDGDRTWLSVGAQYKFSKSLAVDIGYAYLFVDNASIHQNAGNTAASGLIDGSYKNNVQIVSGQLTYSF